MKFGVCGDPKMALVAKSAGYDYFEWSVGDFLRPREGEAAFETSLEQVQKVGLPCLAANVFVPGDLKITGPDAHMDALEAFVSTALRRAGTAGVQTIVFGSGGARRVPDGFDRKTAWSQLVDFGKMLAPIAGRYRVTIAVEPLNLTECNILNTVGEAALLVKAVDHPYFRLLADGYHWGKDGDTTAGIVDNAGLLVHTHIATVKDRLPPNAQDPCTAFFGALRQAGYEGRVSIEGVIKNPETELPLALEIMRSQAL